MRSNIEWQAWGEKDPLWGVASWTGRQKSGPNPWTDSEFYALGEDWLDFQEHWTRYGLVQGKCLEIGCGVGRITARLAQFFQSVTALDVSSAMLAYAMKRISAANIEWCLSDGDRIPCADDTFDAVFSCHVFQHFPDAEAGFQTFREIARVLKPGGTFMVHLPVHHFPPAGRFAIARVAHSLLASVSAARTEMQRRRLKYGGSAPIPTVSYELGRLFPVLSTIGFTRVELSVFTARTSRENLHACVMGSSV